MPLPRLGSIRSAAALLGICLGFITLLTFLFLTFGVRVQPRVHRHVLESDLNVYASAMELYRINHGDYPPAKHWHTHIHPDIASDRLPLDPWGDPLIYQKTTSNGVTTIRLFSMKSDPSDSSQFITRTCKVVK